MFTIDESEIAEITAELTICGGSYMILETSTCLNPT